MIKRLIVAEKNSQASSYAQALGKFSKSGASYIVSKLNLHIAPAAGHLLDIVNDIEPAYKEPLPYFPKEILYGFKPQGAKKSDRDNHLKTIKFLYNNLKKEIAWADEIIIGTDPDREGESIFYTLLNQFPEYRKKVKYRLWANSLTKDGIQKAYNHLRPAHETYNFFVEADARRTADWLVGVANLTPLVRSVLKTKGQLQEIKKTANKKGYEKLSVGRVKAPIMNLIIENDNKIAAHVPKDFWKIEVQDENGVIFTNEQVFGGDKNSLSESDAKQVLVSLSKNAKVIDVIKEVEDKKAPFLFNLTQLQAYMSQHHHFSSAQTLSVAESLYQKKVMSYPRTDSKLITEYEFAYLKVNLKKYQELLGRDFSPAYTEARKKYVNTDKVKEHYALIPTETLPVLSELSHDERLVYETVTTRMLIMFEKDQKLAVTKVTIDNGKEFSVSGTVILEEGWHSMALKSKKEKEPLPNYEKGQILKVENRIKAGKTQPPARLTESTMLKTVLVKYGIGTSATRASILAGLVRDGFVELDKKTGQYIPLEKARKTIRALEELGSQFANPEKTSEWEMTLKLIGEGKLEAHDFLEGIREEIRETVKGQVK
ncbi:type IA DNA topoisomerase [Lactococcus lactis]|uniref:type IA DNA topoisomerase n=1 Tax=Lactococcus lactis TaxID=1358 RepID=UPI001D08E421|nr:DNA topoisomerase [Lactococcus lactis]MCB6851385.1 DNA topoisomerase III [Lactococcus lactis]MDU6581529.1 DNA topoisomerase [Lactococcus lactis]